MTTNPVVEREWPFSRSELTAGLRRYLAASSLRLLDIQPIPLPRTMPGVASVLASGTTLRAMAVGVRIEGEDQNLPLVVKEPPVTSQGRVLRAVGQREYGVYQRLAPHLPVLVPGLVAGDETEGWIVLEVLTGLRPVAEWTVADYEEALLNLVTMHDRFWGLSEDLSTFAWLARPFDADYQHTVLAAVEAVEILMHEERLPELNAPQYLELFGALTRSADEIARPLRAETATLIHGDYWPGNIARPLDGRQIVFDWQLAGIGPAILDLVGFVQSVQMRLDAPLTIAEMIAFYRAQAGHLSLGSWDEERFAYLWDHALLWSLMSNWLVKLARITPANYAQIHPEFARVWLAPAQAAVARWLTP